MGLSEHEQQLLDDMERRLYQSEADVMHTPAVGSGHRLNLRSLVLGIVVVLVGIGLLIGGVAAQQLWLGLLGFAAMLGGAVLAFTKSNATAEAGDSSKSTRSRAGNAERLSDRLGRRWDERMEGER